MLALHGQGRYDRVPAGDLGFLKLVGRLLTGNPQARVEEDEVRAFFAPYGAWKGLAGEYLRFAAANGLLNPAARRRAPARQELVRHRPRPRLGPRDQLLLAHPRGVGVPPVRVLPAERPLGVRGEEHGQRGVDRRGLQAPVEPLVGGQQPVEADLRARAQELVPARRGLEEAPDARRARLVQLLPPGDEHELRVGGDAQVVHALDARPVALARELDALVVPEGAERRVDPAASASPARG